MKTSYHFFLKCLVDLLVHDFFFLLFFEDHWFNFSRKQLLRFLLFLYVLVSFAYVLQGNDQFLLAINFYCKVVSSVFIIFLLT